jgi:Carboxypeptidase regulatory-like domain
MSLAVRAPRDDIDRAQALASKRKGDVMKHFRILFLAAVTLLIAVPSFAQCGHCVDGGVHRITTRRAPVLLPLFLFSVVVSIDRAAYSGPVDVAVMKNDVVIATKAIDAKAATTELRELQPGTYTIVVRGNDPLERLARTAMVRQGEQQRLAFAPKPQKTVVRLTRGGKPLANATLTLTHATAQWRTTLNADANGIATTNVWEPGTFSVAVRGGGLVTPYITRQTFGGHVIAIDVPARDLAGIVNSVSGEPVAHARVLLHTTREGRSATVRTTSDDAGRFRFTGVDESTYTINVDAAGFLRPEPIAAGDGDVRIVLERGLVREVRVVAVDGKPIAGAAVICATSGAMRSSGITNEQGRAKVATPAGTATLFAIPKEGSFAIRRVGSEERSVRIDVPEAAASLEVATLTTDGTPVPDVSLLVRYNGEVVPPELARRL